MTELDPHGKDPHQPGAKLDAGKVRIGLCFMGFARALEAVAEVTTHGAEKYTPGGWLKVPDAKNRYTEAMFRHLLAEGKGEFVDTHSHLLHAAHAAWNALARLEFICLEAEEANEVMEQLHRRALEPNWRSDLSGPESFGENICAKKI